MPCIPGIRHEASQRKNKEASEEGGGRVIGAEGTWRAEITWNVGATGEMFAFLTDRDYGRGS